MPRPDRSDSQGTFSYIAMDPYLRIQTQLIAYGIQQTLTAPVLIPSVLASIALEIRYVESCKGCYMPVVTVYSLRPLHSLPKASIVH